MYWSGNPFSIPLELCYITEREISKAQQYFCGANCHFQNLFPLLFARDKTGYLHHKPQLNTKPED